MIIRIKSAAKKRPHLLLPIARIAVPVRLVAYAKEVVAGFGPGEVGEDDIVSGSAISL